MNGNSYINWQSMSDVALAHTIGSFIKHQRTQQNKTQNELAKLAGMSRSTLSLLERGEPVNLMSLLQVLRVLNQLHVLESFLVKPQISPIQLAEEQKKVRYRVRKKGNDSSQKNESSW
jgi:transcriptional regulator with XRE-family HTH domain